METGYLDASHYKVAMLVDELLSSAQDLRNLQLINQLKPEFSVDGDQYCYLLGKDLQSGIAGFGDTVAMAVHNFCQAYYTERIKKPLR